MDILIWSGAALSLIGLIGIVWSAVLVMRARREGLEDDALKARVAKVLPINMGALLLAVLGLMCVILGVSLS